jgi:hypothetical protein
VAPENDGDLALTALGFWPADALQRLHASWITTAQQIVAISATPGGIESLVQQTGLAERDLHALIERTARLLPEGVRETLSKPADTSQFGRGAVRAPEPNKWRKDR